jgi:HlyD family secretion protein
MSRTHRWWLGSALGALVLALALAVGLFLRRSRREVMYTAAAAGRQDLKDSVTANGEIQARTRVNVGTSVTGEIKRLHVTDGQWVKAGDLLVTLDQEHYRQQLTQAELGLRMVAHDEEKAEAAWRKGADTWRRKDALFREGLVSAEEHQNAGLERQRLTADRQRAQAAVRQARALAAQHRDALAKTVLRAPIAGRVTGLKAEQGETAVAGQTNVAGAVLMVISRLDEMLAEVKVGELDVVKLKPGQSAEIQVDALPGKVFPGRVLEVATAVDGNPNQGFDPSSQVQNYRVRVRILAEGADLAALRPGMSARVAVLAGERSGALSVPLQAIQDRESRPGPLGLILGSQPTVFVVKDGVAQERTLRLGLVTRQAAEVLEGLTEGERVVTGPTVALNGLASGARIRLQDEAPL